MNFKGDCHPLISLQTFRLFGRVLGSFFYLFGSKNKTRAHLNIIRAFPHFSPKKRRKIARGAFQNLSLVALEMCWLAWRKKYLSKCLTFRGEKEVFSRLRQGGGVVILSSHQANWEFPVIALSQLFPGTAIGKPFKRNRWLYNRVLLSRQAFGAKVVPPKGAIAEGIKALKRGEFFAFLDRSQRKGKYSYPFLGIPTSTSIAPALLAYKTQSPLVVLMTRKTKRGYEVSFSPLLYPNVQNPFKKEVECLMGRAMQIMEKSILRRPEEWMWMYNRWRIKKRDLFEPS